MLEEPNEDQSGEISHFDKLKNTREYVEACKEQLRIKNGVISQTLVAIDKARDTTNIKPSVRTIKKLEDQITYTILFLKTSKMENTLADTKKLLQVCYYCGKVLCQQFLNRGCYMNRAKFQKSGWVPFSTVKPPEDFDGSAMHFWGEPSYKHNILKYFVITNRSNEVVDTEDIDRVATFYIIVIMAKLHKNLLQKNIQVKDMLEKIKELTDGFVTALNFKFVINNDAGMDFDECEVLSEFLVMQTFGKHKLIRDLKRYDLIDKHTMIKVCSSFDKYNVHMMMFKDAVRIGKPRELDLKCKQDEADFNLYNYM